MGGGTKASELSPSLKAWGGVLLRGGSLDTPPADMRFLGKQRQYVRPDICDFLLLLRKRPSVSLGKNSVYSTNVWPLVSGITTKTYIAARKQILAKNETVGTNDLLSQGTGKQENGGGKK